MNKDFRSRFVQILLCSITTVAMTTNKLTLPRGSSHNYTEASQSILPNRANLSVNFEGDHTNGLLKKSARI